MPWPKPCETLPCHLPESLLEEPTPGGTFRAEVIPDDDTGEWKQLIAPEDIVQFYDLKT